MPLSSQNVSIEGIITGQVCLRRSLGKLDSELGVSSPLKGKAY